jgi:hypothetical protein
LKWQAPRRMEYHPRKGLLLLKKVKFIFSFHVVFLLLSLLSLWIFGQKVGQADWGQSSGKKQSERI